MCDNINTNKNKDLLEYVTALTPMAAKTILIELCKDDNLTNRIVTMARASLSNVDADDIKDKIFRSLNTILVEDLWDNSGKTRWGYNDPTDVAYKMIGTELGDYILQMEQYRYLGMKKEEKEYCKGIISGLLSYGQDGNNEFHDAVPDDPYTHAENVLYDWKQNNTEEDVSEVQAVYDSFFTSEENECAKVLVDADACPVKQIIVRLAKQKDIPVTMLFDNSHEYSDGYSKVITVDQGPDSVDFILLVLINPGDIVVTQDYGLAAMALGNGAKVINQNGLIYTNENIDSLLLKRHINNKTRRGGGKAKGPGKRTKSADAKFETVLESILNEIE